MRIPIYFLVGEAFIDANESRGVNKANDFEGVNLRDVFFQFRGLAASVRRAVKCMDKTRMNRPAFRCRVGVSRSSSVEALFIGLRSREFLVSRRS